MNKIKIWTGNAPPIGYARRDGLDFWVPSPRDDLGSMLRWAGNRWDIEPNPQSIHRQALGQELLSGLEAIHVAKHE